MQHYYSNSVNVPNGTLMQFEFFNSQNVAPEEDTSSQKVSLEDRLRLGIKYKA